MAISISGLPPIPNFTPETDPTTSEDLDKAIESLAVTMLSDRSFERMQETWKEEHKHDRP